MIRKVVVIIKQNINILLTNVYKMHIKYIHNIKGKKERGNGIKSLMFQIHFCLLKNFRSDLVNHCKWLSFSFITVFESKDAKCSLIVFAYHFPYLV